MKPLKKSDYRAERNFPSAKFRRALACVLTAALLLAMCAEIALSAPSSSPDNDQYYFKTYTAPDPVLLSDGSESGTLSGGNNAIVTKDKDGYTVDYGVTNVMGQNKASPAPGTIYRSAAVITNDTDETWILDKEAPFTALSWAYLTRSSPYDTYDYYKEVMDKWLIFKFEITAPNSNTQTLCNYSTITDFSGNDGYHFPDESNSHVFRPESLDGDYYAKAPIAVDDAVVLKPDESISVTWNFGMAWESDNGTQAMYMDFNFRVKFRKETSSTEPPPAPTQEPDPTASPDSEDNSDDDEPSRPKPPASGASSGSDAAENAPAAEEWIEPYIFGYPDSTFKPDTGITRAESAAIFARLSGEYTIGAEGQAWYEPSLDRAVKNGILKGYPDGSLRPNAQISRAEFVALIERDANNLSSGNIPFADVSETHWARDYIASILAKGLITGYPDGTFRPSDPITRAEAVTIINSYIERAGIDAVSPFSDISASYWAFRDILAASVRHTAQKATRVPDSYTKILLRSADDFSQSTQRTQE
ncbi:MAG: S-layer homology domain-containing protein [Oscillospiraceae bacterium]|jgi:hypothetical protein|nr:S-layer homology domain-containing protein [Oscillospiraceae bacterium]